MRTVRAGRWIVVTMLAAAATLAASGCGGGSSSSASLCKDYSQLGGVSGTDTATLNKAAALYRKLAADAAAAKADLELLADDEDKVANGDAASVDSSAASAAAERAGSVIGGKCGANTTAETTAVGDQSSSDTGGGQSATSFCDDVQASLTVGGDNPGLRGPDPDTLQQAADTFHKVADETPPDAPASVKDDLNQLADIEIKVKNGSDTNLDADAASAAADGVRTYASTACEQLTTPETTFGGDDTSTTLAGDDTSTTVGTGYSVPTEAP